jgi:hypothetical protein
MRSYEYENRNKGNFKLKDARLKAAGTNSRATANAKSRREAGATKSFIVLTHSAGPQNYWPRVAFFFDFTF